MSATAVRRDLAPEDAMPDPSELENRAGIASLAQLQHERRQMLPVYARLRTLYGPPDLWEKRRSQMMRALKIRALRTLEGQGVAKPPEWRVEGEAAEDPQYLALLDEGEAGSIEYITMETRWQEIAEAIASRLSELSAYSAECRLTR